MSVKFLTALLTTTAFSPAVLAQINWVSVVADNTRIKAANGSVASYIVSDPQEKDMAFGDLNKDGWTDLVIVRKQPNTTSGAFPNYLLMNENGLLVDRSAQYASASDVGGDNGFMTATNDRDVVFSDVNMDGWLDVITATTLSDGQPKHISHPRVYINRKKDANGNWLGLRFENSRIPLMTPTPRFCAVAAGDVTGDGAPDLYFADYGNTFDKLLINNGNGTFSDSGFTRMGQAMLDAAFGTSANIVDMNGDGFRDVIRSSGVTGAGSGPMVSIAYNNPNNVGFFPSSLYASSVASSAPYHADVGDLNHDNKPDVISSDDGADTHRYNTGNDAQGKVIWGALKSFQFSGGSYTDEGFAGTNHMYDVNGDGWLDAVICDVDVDIGGCNRHSKIYHNPGGPVGSQMTLREEFGNGYRGVIGMVESDFQGTFDVAVFDIDNDGDNDIVYGRCSGTFVWMNQQNPVVCQQNVGNAGPGVATLSMCGPPLLAGQHGDLVLTGAPANAVVRLLTNGVNANVPFAGGTVIVPRFGLQATQLPGGNVPTTSATGTYTFANAVQGGGGPHSRYFQVLVTDPSQTEGVTISNVVRADILP